MGCRITPTIIAKCRYLKYSSVIIDCVSLDVFDEGGAWLGLGELLGAVEVVEARGRIIVCFEVVVSFLCHWVLETVPKWLDMTAVRSTVRVLSRGTLSEFTSFRVASLNESRLCSWQSLLVRGVIKTRWRIIVVLHFVFGAKIYFFQIRPEWFDMLIIKSCVWNFLHWCLCEIFSSRFVWAHQNWLGVFANINIWVIQARRRIAVRLPFVLTTHGHSFEIRTERLCYFVFASWWIFLIFYFSEVTPRRLVLLKASCACHVWFGLSNSPVNVVETRRWVVVRFPFVFWAKVNFRFDIGAKLLEWCMSPRSNMRLFLNALNLSQLSIRNHFRLLPCFLRCLWSSFLNNFTVHQFWSRVWFSRKIL